MGLEFYKPLFRRLLLFPMALLVLLCAVLSYGLWSVEQRSLAIDDADLVIAHSNNLIKLMVDEETGLRGYLLTQNPVFLQPLRAAEERLNSEFSALFGLIGRSPDETRLLVDLKLTHQDWMREANDEIRLHSSTIPDNDFLLQRKQKMDRMRAEMDRLLNWAESQRSLTLSNTLKTYRTVLFGSVDLAILVAAFLIWQSQYVISRIIRAHLEMQDGTGQNDSHNIRAPLPSAIPPFDPRVATEP
jgi:CHASE3 domain sensor protein